MNEQERLVKALQAGRDTAETPDVKNAFEAAALAAQSVDDLPIPGENGGESTNGQPPVVPDTPTPDPEPVFLTRIVPQLAIVKGGQYSEKNVEIDLGDGDVADIRLTGERIDPGDYDQLHHKLGQVRGSALKYGAWMVDGDWIREPQFEPQMVLEGGKSKLVIGVDRVQLLVDGQVAHRVDAAGGGTTRTIKFTPEALEVLVDQRVVLGVDNKYFNESSVMTLALITNGVTDKLNPTKITDEFAVSCFYFEEEAYEAENPGEDVEPGGEVPVPGGSSDDGPVRPEEPATPQLKVDLPTDRPHWLGNWSGNVRDYCRNVVQQLAGKTALFISYNIPNRDNGNFSAGGLDGINAFENWARDIAEGIGSAPAWVVLEPDALGLLDGLNDQGRNERNECLRRAITILETKPNIFVFVDASTWVNPQEMRRRLDAVGAKRFSCNVSGYYKTEEVKSWADQVGLPFIIDTSRNGNGNPHPPAWCNVTDTKIGDKPALVEDGNFLAKLWAKVPGESDGLKINGHDQDGQPNRNDIPGAGGEWPEFKEAIYSGDWAAFHAKYHA